MKFLTFILCFLLCSTIFATEPDVDLHNKCIYPTVKVCNADEQEGGSGFIVRSEKIDDDYQNIVVVATHVIDAIPKLFVSVAKYNHFSYIDRYEKYPFIVYAKDHKRDIAVGFFLSKEKMPVVELCFDKKLYINTEIFHVGYGLLDDARIDFGQVTQPKTIYPEQFFGLIRTNCYTFLGDSGGPLFLKSNYKVVGICQSIRTHKDMRLSHISYYIPIDNMLEWNCELDNAIESAFNHKVKMPVTPFIKLKIKQYEFPNIVLLAQ